MMNFKQWLEGFGFDTRKSTDTVTKDFLTQFKDVKKSSGRHEIISKHATEHDLLYFSEEDRPSDLIRLVQLNKIESLPFFNIKRSLPSFEGGKIYYAFTFAPSENFELLSKKIGTQTKELGAYVDTTVDRRKKEIQLITNDIQKKIQVIESKFVYAPRLEQSIPNLWHLFSQFQNDHPILNRNAIESTKNMFGHSLSLPQLQDLINWFNSDEREDWLSLKQELNSIQLKSRSTDNRLVLSNKDSKNFFTNACLSAVNIIKNPQTDNQKNIQEKFIELAVQAYVSKAKNKGYDYVIWPESGSLLNQKVAEKLAQHYNAEPMQGFNKRSREDTRLDRTTAHRQGHNTSQMQQHFDSRIKNGNPNSKPTIKGVTQNSVKPFVRMWDINRPEIGKYRKARILVVDDTSNSGATMQSIHKVLISEKPRQIDMFVPIQLNTYFKTSTVNQKTGVN